jgi:hypothetical protein
MVWFSNRDPRRRQRERRPRAWTIEGLETRALLADGIAASPGPALIATQGVPLANVTVATFAITDPSGAPGDKWQAKIDWGDGRSDLRVPPIPNPDGTFRFAGSHTYTETRSFTITVMIAVPRSMRPNENTVTTLATVTPAGPPPTSSPLTATGTAFVARAGRTFRGLVASFAESGSRLRDFRARINWGDGSSASAGQIKGQGPGRFAVIGTHRFRPAGAFAVTIAISDRTGHTATAQSTATVSASNQLRTRKAMA